MTPAETRDILIETMGAEMQSWFEANRLNFSDEMAEHLLDTLSAKLRELGLKIVPVEATEEMNEALVETVTNGTCIGANDVVEWAPYVEDRAWSAMLAAAPDVLGGGDE